LAGLIAVITDGLGSTRLDIYDLETMRPFPRRDGWSRGGEVIASSDGRLWFDWPDIMDQFLDEIRAFERAGDIEALVPISRGAVVGLFDKTGRLLPAEVEDYSGAKRRGGVISYFSMTDPSTDELINRMASPAERYEMYGVPPNFVGYAVPGWAIADIALLHPEEVAAAGGVAFGPELIARLVCGEMTTAERSGLELTYLMCHTGLYKDAAWSPLAVDIDRLVQQKTGRKLLGDLFPAIPGRSSEIFAYSEPGGGPDGRPLRFAVLKGGHDSTFGDVPVVAAGRSAFSGRDFITFQAGSWGMARLVTAAERTELPAEGFGRHVMYQADLDGRLVLTALAPTGIEFQHYGGKGLAGNGLFLEEFGLDSLPHEFDPGTLREVIAAREIFVMPGVAAGTGPFPASESKVIGMDAVMAERSGGMAYMALNLMTSVMSAATIELVSGGADCPVVLSAGGAADSLYRLLLASLLPEREVYYIEDDSGQAVTETTSAGGFLVGLEGLKGTPAYSIAVSGLGYKLVRSHHEDDLIEGLRAYRTRFEDLAV
jgi:Carbohydrate kinase FGGY, C-terminal domain